VNLKTLQGWSCVLFVEEEIVVVFFVLRQPYEAATGRVEGSSDDVRIREF
jgi:hypothetical protein